MELTQKQIEEIKDQESYHQARLDIGINDGISQQSLKIAIEHIKDPKLSEGRKID